MQISHARKILAQEAVGWMGEFSQITYRINTRIPYKNYQIPHNYNGLKYIFNSFFNLTFQNLLFQFWAFLSYECNT